MRRLPGAGLGIDTDSEIRVYDILDADADSNGPGSTWGRTHVHRFAAQPASPRMDGITISHPDY